MNQMITKTYNELKRLKTFEERYEYLKIGGKVGEDTFGFDRYLNQVFYKSKEWQSARNYVITRDNGCDLGIPGHDIHGYILVHHMNPITKEDVLNRSPKLFDPNNLICTSKRTHDGIHYGTDELPYEVPVERSRNDTCPWKR